MRVSPTVSAPKISARCEIDLSPGTRARPLRAPARRAESGDGAAWSTGNLGLGQGSLACGRKGVIRPSGARPEAATSPLGAIDTGRPTRQVKHLIFDPCKEPGPWRNP